MSKIKTAILVSGRGSNMQNLIEHTKKNSFLAKIDCVISNKEGAQAILKAKEHNIQTCFFENDHNFEEKLTEIITKRKIEIICCAGFMRILSAVFIKNCQKQNISILNIHPSLLPKFKGLNAVKKAFEAQDEIVGATVHIVNEKVDDGKIILQEETRINRENKPNLKMLEKIILKLEHKIYPVALEKICKT